MDFQLASELFSEPHVSLDAIEWDCTVSLQESDADRLAVLMMCSDGEASGKTLLSISTAPDVPATVFPNQVKLHFVDRSNLNIRQWIRVETLSSDLVFAASIGYHPSPEGIEVADWYHPLKLDYEPSVCALVDHSCGARERFQLRWTDSDDNSLDILGPNTGNVGIYSVWVQEAEQFSEQTDCIDIAHSHFRLAVLAQHD